MIISKNQQQAMIHRVLHAAAEGFSNLDSDQYSSHHVTISNGFSTWSEPPQLWLSRESCVSSTSNMHQPGLGLSAHCSGSDPMMCHQHGAPQIAGLSQPANTAVGNSSLKFPWERTRQGPDANTAKLPTGMQQEFHAESAISSFRYAPASEELMPAGDSAAHRKPLQPASEHPASEYAWPAQKRRRQSFRDTSVVCAVCLQASSTPAISSLDHAQASSQQRLADGETGQTSNQTVNNSTAHPDPSMPAALTNQSPSEEEHEHGEASIQEDLSSCQPDGKAGIPQLCMAHAIAAAADHQPQGVEAKLTSRDGTPIRLMITEREQHMGGFLQAMGQPIPDTCDCFMTERLPILRNINRLRGVAAQSAKFKAMYRCNIEVIPQSLTVPLRPISVISMASRTHPLEYLAVATGDIVLALSLDTTQDSVVLSCTLCQYVGST